ncbi:MAG: alpha/beta fold hydrolase, partial [Nanoarchaeota archaeon]|nr:alpha/beta fold hydrolase [Nanoarchaeota archaeon]
MRKHVKKFKEDHRKQFFIIIAIIAIIIIFSWVKIGLYLNFLLGNDVLIKMQVDNDQFFIINGDTEDLNVEASVQTNPFCKAYCIIEFRDVSSNQLIDQEEFTLNTGMPYNKKYVITNSNNMQGQDIYSVKMDCSGKESFLCHTTEEVSTRRDAIITVNHGLNEGQQKEKESIKNNVEKIKEALSSVSATYYLIKEQKESGLGFNVVEWDTLLEKEEQDIKYVYGSLNSFSDKWSVQDFDGINSDLTNSRKIINEKLTSAKQINSEMKDSINQYNGFVFLLKDLRTDILPFTENRYTDSIIFNELSSLITHFNSALDTFENQDNLVKKESTINWINNEVDLHLTGIGTTIKYEVLDREIEGDINYDVLCNIDINYCFSHPTINNRENQGEFNVEDSCNYSQELISTLNIINSSIAGYVSINYPNNPEFWKNISSILSNKKRSVMVSYVNSLTSGPNYNELISILVYPEMKIEAGYGDLYIKNALLWQLIKESPNNCVFQGNLPELDSVSLSQIELIEGGSIEGSSKDVMEIKNISFEEPSERCCILGECYDCCEDDECYSNENNYPVILVHGHAFNKGVSAEYSLDAFNILQDTLESDGYLSAGSINLYAEQEESYYGKWSKIPLPLTIKVSYYYDILQEEGNYQIIQTKSENIETYSLRLKEIIDIVKSKTRRDKVVIVAHSMGGLVVRRYLQIFGEDNVEKIVFVGSPHNGITGDIESLCPLLG